MVRKSKYDQASPAGQAAAEEVARTPEVKLPKEKFQKVFVLNAEQRRILDRYCGDANVTIQDLVIEGINLVFRSKGLPEI